MTETEKKYFSTNKAPRVKKVLLLHNEGARIPEEKETDSVAGNAAVVVASERSVF